MIYQLLQKQLKNLRGIGKDSSKYFPAKIFAGVLGFFALPLFSWLFDTEEYGEYQLVFTLVLLFSSVISGWLSQGSLRFYHLYEKNTELEKFYVTILYLNLLLIIIDLVIGSLAFFLLYSFKFVETLYLLLMGVLTLTTSSVSGIQLNLLRAKNEATIYSILIVAQAIAKLLVPILGVLWLDMGVETIFYSIIITDLIIVLISCFKLRLLFYLKNGYFDFQLSKRFFSFGMPLIGTGVFYWVLDIIDRFFIGYFYSNKEVGIYALNYQIAYSTLFLLFSSLMLAAYPGILKCWQYQGKLETETLISDLLKYYFILMVPATVGLSSISEQVVSILFSSEYIEGYVVIPWVACGMFFLGLSQYYNKAWELNNRTIILLMLNIIAALINIVLNFWLIPLYGYTIAGVTTCISLFTYLILSIVLNWIIGFKIKLVITSVIKVFFASIIMGYSAYIILIKFENILGILLSISVGFLVYILVLCLTGELKSELKWITKKLNNSND